MVMNTYCCPKCQHRFALTAQCAAARATPCLCLGGAVPAASLSQPAQPTQSPMLSISITAASASALNGGHVVVNTVAPSPGSSISMCATLPTASLSLPWSSSPAWNVSPLAEPSPLATWSASATTSPSWTTAPTLPMVWGAPPPPPLPPTTLNLRFSSSVRPQSPAPPPTPKGVQYRLTGGGILHERGGTSGASGGEEPVLLQPRSGCGKLGVLSCGCGPEQSPSTPLSFVLPVMPPLLPPLLVRPLVPAEQQGTPETDLKQLQSTTRALKNSGWYYEGYSWQESAATLKDAAPGTFLVRDSSDPRFLFSLSVQTDRGPTSVRLHYIAGGFRLDAEPHLAPTMPLFPCVLQLVEHYVASSRRAKRSPPSGTGRTSVREQVWVDARGQMYSHILVTEPRRHSVPGLQHLARLAVNKQLRAAAKPSSLQPDVSRLELPTSIRKFLEDYPFTL